MKIVQSFRGLNGSKKWLAVNAILYTLSAMLCKRHGYYTKLYCDDKFYEYIGDIASEYYDEIDLSVNDFPTPPTHIYADTKFRVMQNESLGTIHMDGDVFLFKADILNNLIDEDFDVLIQHKETRKRFGGINWDGSVNSLMYCKKPSWAKSDCDAMYNCGVICIKNEKLKQEYFKTYWEMYDEYDKHGIKHFTIPDIIIEQQYLTDLCEYRGYKVKEILPEDTFQEYARSIGYSHLTGKGKFLQLKNVLKVIYKYNKDTYKNLKDKFYGREIFNYDWPY